MPNLAPTVTLNNGMQMPVIGLGTFTAYGNDVAEAVCDALDYGYRHIDTACVYNNEKEIGEAIKEKINEKVVTREDLFIVTKLASQDNAPQLVEKACRRSLKNLQLSYVDLYLIHFPVNDDNADYIDTWREMEKLVDLGLTKSIGVSNFNSEQVERILSMCRIKPVTNQVECHPGFNQSKLKKFCTDRGIILTAYCPLGRPRPNHHKPAFLYNAKFKDIAHRYGKTPTQVALRFLIQHDVVPIPKSVTKKYIQSNFDVFDFQLSQEDMAIIESLTEDKRIIPFSALKDCKYFPFDIEF